MNCCCKWGIAVSGEWPEFECNDCPRHGGGMTDDYMCRRHKKAHEEAA